MRGACVCLLVLVTACAGTPDTDETVTDQAVRMTYVQKQDADEAVLNLARHQPGRIVMDFPGQSVNINQLPADIARLLDACAEHGGAIRLRAWDEDVRERGMLELRAAVQGARYIRSLYQLSQRELQRRRERRLGDYDIDVLFDPHSGALVYLRFERTIE